ncbi:CRE-PME-3 protein [Caenorhabditis remanei]|uniref:poly(ADP-ribose) glycohydrolase n=1 Tax=Caenorhabditis remanei TaxID=31234 RepID=E3NDC8_CAERE|nr:CRE-PME-3 protein [Caenorhabditis remanei]
MTSSELTHISEVFDERNLIFQPDYSSVDPKRHYRYCSISGMEDPEHFHRFSEDTEKELLLKQYWRPVDENGTPNPHYLENRTRLENFLKEYKNTGGIELLETTILEILNSDERIVEKFESLPGLRKFFKVTTERIEDLMEKFANVVRIALRVEDVLPVRIYRLVDDVISATFSQEQCAVLLAWMFFDSRRNRSFLNILNSTHPISIEKIKFLLHYFEKVTEEMPQGVISFMRIKNSNFWENEFEKNREKKLSKAIVFDELLIEQTALCTQIDFANKHIGGGVLRLGGVQEEIRFLMCPEMIVSMLLFDRMEPDEAISIVGAQVYSSYSGYSGKLKWQPLSPSDALQNNPDYRDRFGRLQTEAMAINAIKFFGRQFKNMSQQLEEQNLKKELLKCGVAFTAQDTPFEGIPVVSGWWGCGAYGGNKPLKFLIQLIASSIANRPLYLCTFGESQMGNKCKQMMRRLEIDQVTVGELYDLLLKVPKLELYEEMHVFDSIEEMLCRRSQ